MGNIVNLWIFCHRYVKSYSYLQSCWYR